MPIRTSRFVRLVAPVILAAAIFPATTNASAKPAVKRVFVYVMENTSYDSVVGAKDAPYLNSLIKHFALATNYVATGHASLDNYIAMTSGQVPNPGTMADCMFYGTPLCIQNVNNVADQLEHAHLTWKGYMDGMPGQCAHTDENTREAMQKGYTPRHNPFVYYRSIMGNDARCKAHIVPMTQLWKDVKANTVPAYAFVTPDTCHDGHDSGTSCTHGGGVKEADWFASKTVPRLLASKAWKDGGLLVLTFDEGGIPGDDLPRPSTQLVDFGGRIYTLLASPNVKPGIKLAKPYDHYSLLATTEDAFCLPRIGGAKGADSMLPALGLAGCAR